jgi:hypothetical protein
MRTVTVSKRFEGTVPEAERCWYETSRWPQWVDGVERIVSVDPEWPAAGARVVWESGPAGRGRVTEEVLAREALRGQTLEVQDDSIRGRQGVTFTPADPGVEVVLWLEYELRRPSLPMRITDLLFIRRAMTDSLKTTIGRFGVELEESRRRA